ncbi:hypothetical protein EVAR_27239_1 [Eumeta japonica]|uniref:Uncharacterized protein n=1 Tax=Eumeta variegata TaxID=151549 RepID=A0A4C1W276_EUMVA|nr:hypothetical protein EVAR_27239_1 [Eumeta japonica]
MGTRAPQSESPPTPSSASLFSGEAYRRLCTREQQTLSEHGIYLFIRATAAGPAGRYANAAASAHSYRPLSAPGARAPAPGCPPARPTAVAITVTLQHERVALELDTRLVFENYLAISRNLFAYRLLYLV